MKSLINSAVAFAFCLLILVLVAGGFGLWPMERMFGIEAPPLPPDMEQRIEHYRVLTPAGFVVAAAEPEGAKLREAVRVFFAQRSVIPLRERSGVYDLEITTVDFGIWRRVMTPLGHAWVEVPPIQAAAPTYTMFHLVSGREALEL